MHCSTLDTRPSQHRLKAASGPAVVQCTGGRTHRVTNSMHACRQGGACSVAPPCWLTCIEACSLSVTCFHTLPSVTAWQQTRTHMAFPKAIKGAQCNKHVSGRDKMARWQLLTQRHSCTLIHSCMLIPQLSRSPRDANQLLHPHASCHKADATRGTACGHTPAGSGTAGPHVLLLPTCAGCATESEGAGAPCGGRCAAAGSFFLGLCCSR